MSEARTTRHKPQVCPNCGYKIDAATTTPDFPNDSAPGPGDVGLCLNCAHLMVYGEGLVLRAPTDEEMIDIAGDPDVIRAVEAIGRMNKERGNARLRSRRA